MRLACPHHVVELLEVGALAFQVALPLPPVDHERERQDVKAEFVDDALG